MVQYPDTIVITTLASASMNASGIFSEGASASYIFDCRAEANGTGRKIPGADGQLVDYAFQIFMPRTTTVIPAGSDYVLATLLNDVSSGKIKRASNGQLNSRLWV
jgi:hypothetical protein